MLEAGEGWKNGDTLTIKYKRDGKEAEIKGIAKIVSVEIEAYRANDASKAALREAWLKG